MGFLQRLNILTGRCDCCKRRSMTGDDRAKYVEHCCFCLPMGLSPEVIGVATIYMFTFHLVLELAILIEVRNTLTEEVFHPHTGAHTHDHDTEVVHSLEAYIIHVIGIFLLVIMSAFLVLRKTYILWLTSLFICFSSSLAHVIINGFLVEGGFNIQFQREVDAARVICFYFIVGPFFCNWITMIYFAICILIVYQHLDRNEHTRIQKTELRLFEELLKDFELTDDPDRLAILDRDTKQDEIIKTHGFNLEEYELFLEDVKKKLDLVVSRVPKDEEDKGTCEGYWKAIRDEARALFKGKTITEVTESKRMDTEDVKIQISELTHSETRHFVTSSPKKAIGAEQGESGQGNDGIGDSDFEAESKNEGTEKKPVVTDVKRGAFLSRRSTPYTPFVQTAVGPRQRVLKPPPRTPVVHNVENRLHNNRAEITPYTPVVHDIEENGLIAKRENASTTSISTIIDIESPEIETLAIPRNRVGTEIPKKTGGKRRRASTYGRKKSRLSRKSKLKKDPIVTPLTRQHEADETDSFLLTDDMYCTTYRVLKTDKPRKRMWRTPVVVPETSQTEGELTKWKGDRESSSSSES